MASTKEPISKRYGGNEGMPAILSNFGKIPGELLLDIANMVRRSRVLPDAQESK